MVVAPLSAVLAAFESGAATLADVGSATGLSRDVVDASVAHLVRELSVGCPSGGCGGCASAVGGEPGCGAPGPSRRRSGPALVALTVRRPTAS